MLKEEKKQDQELITQLIHQVKNELEQFQYKSAYAMTVQAMHDFPDRAEPHNLLGIYYMMRQQHALAMRHFRAAWALDPTFAPARTNLEQYGSFDKPKTFVYEEEKPKSWLTKKKDNRIVACVWRHSDE